MADIVNLNHVRKTRKRRKDAAQATVNRAAFGRTKAEREREKAEAARRAQELAGKRIEPED